MTLGLALLSVTLFADIFPAKDLRFVGAARWISCPEADGEEEKQQALKSFKRGEEAFGRRQFVRAARAFERAACLEAHPSAWLNAAEAWERAGDLGRAAEDLEEVIAMGPNAYF